MPFGPPPGTAGRCPHRTGMSLNTGPFSEAVQWLTRSKVPMLHICDLNPLYQSIRPSPSNAVIQTYTGGHIESVAFYENKGKWMHPCPLSMF